MKLHYALRFTVRLFSVLQQSSARVCALASPQAFLFSACTAGTFTRKLTRVVSASVVVVLSGCLANGLTADEFEVSSSRGATLVVKPLMAFDHPWAMSFLPNGQLLVSEKDGRLWLVHTSDTQALGADRADSTDPFEYALPAQLSRKSIGGLPAIAAKGQGGLGDVVPHPDFNRNGYIYLSYVEHEGDISGAAVARAQLTVSQSGEVTLESWEVLWRQQPKVSGHGHYGYRLAFSADGHLFISSGERQKFDPAQDMQQNLGKIIRLQDDGGIPDDNPFKHEGGVAEQVWSLGHRNPLGMAFDSEGQLWAHEMGPRGGDELNRIMAGANYGYPVVSDGMHYSGAPIPDHDTRPEFQAPAISWTPVISPAGLVIYNGERYTDWPGTGLIGGLSSRSLVRVSLDASSSEIERYDMGKRIREVEQGAGGVVYLLEDRADGRLLRLEPSG